VFEYGYDLQRVEYKKQRSLELTLDQWFVNAVSKVI